MSLKKAAEQVRAQGRGKDTELVHLTKREVDAMGGLMAAAGARPTKNPKTGLPEFGFLDSMLPTILGMGANFIMPGSGMVVGGLTGALQNKDDPLMGAVLGAAGGYGGGNLAEGLTKMGSTAISPSAISAANAAADPIVEMTLAKEAAMAAGTQPATGMAAFQAGAQNAMNSPMGFVNTMGGFADTAKNAGLAAAPMLYDYMMPGQEEDQMKRPGDGAPRKFDYDAGYTGGTMTGTDFSSERDWFNPTYTRTMATGGQVQHFERGGVPAMTRGAPAPAAAPAAPVQAKNASGMPAFSFNPQTGGFSRVMEQPAAPAFGADDGYYGALEDAKGGRSLSLLGRLFGGDGSQRSGARSLVGTLAQRKMQNGGASPNWKSYAEGGEVHMESGGFVIPADVVSMAGSGSTDAGLAAFGRYLGAQPIKGPGDGQSDDIPARIDGKPVARVANGEAYVPRSTVQKLGGAKKLYDMVERVREMAHGKREQQRPVDLRKALN